MAPVPYSAALARVRDVFSEFETSPGIIVNSIELQDRTQDAARAAFLSGISFDALCAELGRIATEQLQRDQLTAIIVGRAMARWAAPIYYMGGSST